MTEAFVREGILPQWVTSESTTSFANMTSLSLNTEKEDLKKNISQLSEVIKTASTLQSKVNYTAILSLLVFFTSLSGNKNEMKRDLRWNQSEWKTEWLRYSFTGETKSKGTTVEGEITTR